ncbi:MAG: sodium-dependent transporter [Oscillospiraceae bacterium]|nr:sodium-dependent transporter [Oscillospiraceae bacterium]
MEEKNTKTSQGGFSSKIGFVLAAAGSAVGLGNIWRFPYLAAQYGGGIFLLVYLILTVTFGFSLMVTEIAIGRKTGKSVIGAYSDLSRKFAPLGWIAASVPILIFPYYCVIGGWVLKYLTVFITGAGSQAAESTYFGEFIGHWGQPTLFLAIYIGLTAVVVMLGVEKGIEKFSKFLMPVLILITIVVAVYSCTLDGALDGLLYYITPNFENFSLKTVIAAMGQLFYSMSLAMGIMVTYGSYMRKEDSIEGSARHIEIFDTGVAFLAGMMIIPAVFAFSGGDKSALGQGPSLMFVTLPKVFETMPGGNIIGIVFFVLVALAALTSSISLMETIVSIVCEKTKLKRVPVCLIVLGVSFAIGMLSVLGYSTWSEVTIFGKQFLDFFDFISNSVIMPIVALLTCILIGYVVKTKVVEDEIETNATFKSKKLYRVMIKFICPVFMLAIFISSIIGYV